MNPQYVENPRAGQGHLGPNREPIFRQILGKAVRGFGLVYFIGAALVCKIYVDRKMNESAHDTRLFEASVESRDWRCYHAMRQYNSECSALDPFVEQETEICQTLHKAMDKCQKELYRYINVDVTPAMRPPVYLFNRPEWLK